MSMRTIGAMITFFTVTSLVAQTPKASDPPSSTPKDPAIQVGTTTMLERKAVVGKEFVYQLWHPDYPNAKFTKVSGLDGAIISKSGLLRWTPKPQNGGLAFFVSGKLQTDKEEKKFSVLLRVAQAGGPNAGGPVRPAKRPNAPAVPVPAAPPRPLPAAIDLVIDQAPFFEFSKGAGFPAYLRGDIAALGLADGLRGGEVRTTYPGLGEKNFTFDVLYKFEQRETSDAFVGVTGTAVGTPALNQSVASHVKGPGFGNNVMFQIARQPEMRLGNMDSAGPHLFRITKTGDKLSLAVGSWNEGVFRPTFTKELTELKANAPFLGKSSSAFFGGNATFLGVRLAVDGKTIDPGKPAPPSPDLSNVPFLPVGGTHPLPAFLKSVRPGKSDATGLKMSGALYRTAGDGLFDKNFILDLQFRFDDFEAALITAGLGTEHKGPGNARTPDTIALEIHGPGIGSHGMMIVSGQSDQRINCATKGRHVFRMEKRGETFTLAIGDVTADGEFFPEATRTIGRLSDIAPFLTRRNSTAFISNGGTLEAVRLVVEGKPVGLTTAMMTNKPDSSLPRGVGSVPPGTTTQTAPKIESLSATDAALPGSSHFIALNKGKLPAFIQPQPDLQADEKGRFPGVKVLRTVATDFATKDFTLDVLYHFGEGEAAIAIVGIGPAVYESGRVDLKDCICSRLHSPVPAMANGKNTLTVAGQPERTMGHIQTNGPHLFRLRKRGNVLTMAVCFDFKDQFVPAFEESVLDLKAVAPYLTSKNSWLFATGGGVIDSVRLAVAGEPVESRDPGVSLPERIVEGKLLRTAALRDPAGRKVTLVSGPKGASLSSSGEFTWAPTTTQTGRHEVRLLVSRSKESLLVIRELEVVSVADAKAVNGDLTRIDALYKLSLASEKYSLTPGHDGRSLLLLEGDRLRRLTGNGMTVADDRKLPAKYEKIAERADYFVGLSDDKKALHVLDKKTLAVRRTVPMDYPARTDLTLHPTKAISYVCVEAGGEGPRYRILIVREDTGDVQEPAGFYGTWAAVSPDGRELYAGYRELYQKGNQLLINPDRIHVVPEYGTFDALIIYDITGAKPTRKRLKEEPGGNGNGIVLSPDGKRLSYLSFAGYPVYSGNVPAWNPANLDNRPVSYRTKELDVPAKWVAFHPVLELAATPANVGVMCFHRESGEARPGLADLRSPPLGPVKTERVYFSPDGSHLLLACEANGERVLRRVRLNLTPAETAKVRATKLD